MFEYGFRVVGFQGFRGFERGSRVLGFRVWAFGFQVSGFCVYFFSERWPWCVNMMDRSWFQQCVGDFFWSFCVFTFFCFFLLLVCVSQSNSFVGVAVFQGFRLQGLGLRV